ncbi:hypothetical protein DMC30DRAFT_397177 [Rhodotorula diobovata]|uniref:Uncharacterized protein n=1 Tax=Rhodotorula diobovata TaxID=5288 RepID=A0A5C5FUR6_9BASI|nr:hypothetical protein DMC30DRAFT_397177 [Rhodotorula diobovata]
MPGHRPELVRRPQRLPRPPLTLPLLRAAAVLILVQKKPDKGMPPHNPRWLRLSALVAFLLAMLYVIAGVILFVVLEDRASFVSFCLQNVSSATEEDCDERYNRAWLIVLAVGLVLFIHIALGFPVYRYTRACPPPSRLDRPRGSPSQTRGRTGGPAYGVQLESGFLLEPGIGRRQRELDRRTLRREPSTSASGLSSESESPERRRVRVHARAGARGPRTERREKALAKGQSSRERRHGWTSTPSRRTTRSLRKGPGRRRATAGRTESRLHARRDEGEPASSRASVDRRPR